MNLLLAAAAAVVIVKVLFNLLRLWVVRRALFGLESAPRGRAEAGSIGFAVLFPLLEEQALASQLVKTAADLLDQYPRVTVVFACSGREAGQSPTTRQALMNAGAGELADRGLMLLETDGSDTCKADQLNAALEALGPNECGAEATLVGVYDADSVPQAGILQEVADRFIESSGEVRAFQQLPLYAGRLERFLDRNALVAALGLSRVLYSHKFSYKEAAGYLASGRSLDFRLGHLTGHGYFVEAETLRRCGGFQPPSCDTTLGYQLSLRREPVGLLVRRDVAEVPEDLNTLFRQGCVWFRGCELYPREVQRYLSEALDHRLSPRLAAKVAWVFLTNLSWSFLPILWGVALVAGLVQGQWAWWVVATLCWLSAQLVFWVDFCAVARKVRPVQLPLYLQALTVLISPLGVVLGCLPPIWVLLHRLLGKQPTYRKTSRSEAGRQEFGG